MVAVKADSVLYTKPGTFWFAGAGDVLASTKLADVRVLKAAAVPSVNLRYADGTPEGSCLIPCTIVKPPAARAPALALSRTERLIPACTSAAIRVAVAL